MMTGTMVSLMMMLNGVCSEQTAFVNSLDMRLVRVDACEFTMGSPVTEHGRRDHETLRSVKIQKPYWIGSTEVTQEQWIAIMGTEPWAGTTYVNIGSDFPAVRISFDMAVEFCQRLSRRENRFYRLPTEVEWECACRAGTTTAFHFGDDQKKIGEYAWYGKNTFDLGNRFAHQVGRKKPNPLGLYDMHGNLWEWCDEWFKAPTKKTAGRRVVRGGSWHGVGSLCRSASRFGRPAKMRLNDTGFRVLLVAVVPAQNMD